MKKLLLLFIMLLSISIYCKAQSYTEVVYLKNGSVIKGTIIEQIPNKSLIIKTSDGGLIICKMDEVEKIIKEEKYTEEKKYVKGNDKSYSKAKNILKGYKGFVDLGFIGDVSDSGMSSISLSTSHGYQFNNHIFLGAGLGIDINDGGIAVPLFANFKANILKTKVAPFIDVKVGYSAVDANGAFSSLGVGARFSLKGKKALSLMLEGKYQAVSDDYVYYYDDDYDDSSAVSWGGIGVKIGFEF